MSTDTTARVRRLDTRGDIVRTANQLLLTRSYAGLNFQELADRIGVRKASLYHHFPSKMAVGQAAVDDSAQRFLHWAERQNHLPALQQLQGYVARFRRALANLDMVCPLGATAGDWQSMEPELQQTVRAFHGLQLDWLARQAEGAGLGSAAAARQWALHVNAVCQGALLSVRVLGDPAVFDLCVAPLLENLANLATSTDKPAKAAKRVKTGVAGR